MCIFDQSIPFCHETPCTESVRDGELKIPDFLTFVIYGCTLEEELIELVTLNKKIVTANGNILFGFNSIATNIEALKQNMKENKSPLMIKNIKWNKKWTNMQIACTYRVSHIEMRYYRQW